MEIKNIFSDVKNLLQTSVTYTPVKFGLGVSIPTLMAYAIQQRFATPTDLPSTTLDREVNEILPSGLTWQILFVAAAATACTLFMLTRSSDIVCKKSQGRRDPIYGPKACSSICYQAALHFLEKKTLSSQKDLYAVIDKGIKDCEDNDIKDYQDFPIVLERCNQKRRESLQPELVCIYPDMEGMDLSETEIENMLSVSDNPKENALGCELTKGCVSKYMEMLKKETAKRAGDAAGILTMTNGETVAVFFNSEGHAFLFDSHGRKYNGEDKGASLRKFASIESLEDYLIKVFGKGPYAQFNLHVVTLQRC